MRLKVAHAAREDVRRALYDGLPRLAPTGPHGGYDGLVGLKHAHVTRLINAYVIACKALYDTADALCEEMGWDEDAAEEHGIEFEAAL